MKRLIREIMFPARCVSCDKVLDYDRIHIGFCRKCHKKIRYACEPVCKKCGKVIDDFAKEYCLDCQKRTHYFVQSKGVYVYEGMIKQSMYRFKYSNRRCYRYTFSRDIIKVYGRWIKTLELDGIVPVPMYKKKQKVRGYNQAELIARQLSYDMGIPLYSDLVYRTRKTIPMKGLSDTERQKNLKNAFNFSKKALQLKRVLIIDDIYTTGSTLDSVAKVLHDAGVKEVYGLCMCVGKGYS